MFAFETNSPRKSPLLVSPNLMRVLFSIIRTVGRRRQEPPAVEADTQAGQLIPSAHPTRRLPPKKQERPEGRSCARCSLDDQRLAGSRRARHDAAIRRAIGVPGIVCVSEPKADSGGVGLAQKLDAASVTEDKLGLDT